jgi:hypothetical protein
MPSFNSFSHFSQILKRHKIRTLALKPFAQKFQTRQLLRTFVHDKAFSSFEFIFQSFDVSIQPLKKIKKRGV